jgi:hypothetical protein
MYEKLFQLDLIDTNNCLHVDVAVVVNVSLHFTVPSMNRLNQTESATFSVLPFWTFLKDSYCL